MIKDILVLVDSMKNGFFPKETQSAFFEEIYNSNSLLFRVIRKIIFILHIPKCSFLFGKWFKWEGIPKIIILFDTGNAKYIIPILKRKYSNSRIILWYWNSVDRTINPKEINKDYVELWSFDPVDCEQFNMNHNSQFFPSHILEEIKLKKTNEKDLFFVGTDKGRIDSLKLLKKLAEKNNISFEFYLVGNTRKKIDSLNCKYNKPLSYKEVLKKDLCSTAIVDIVATGQHGLTLRPLEALFLKKKLVTNFILIKEFPFYDKNNIFILGVDDCNSLKSFLSKPYMLNYDVSYYDINNWLIRFKNGI